jgi:cation:H+ antiporter
MLADSLLILAGLVLLGVGAEMLVRGAGSLALRLGIAPLVVGLTIVAFATGAPELAVSVKGAVTGNSGIALGNIVGSNISNIALVLGIAALVRPMKVQARLVRREMPLMVGATLLLCALLIDGSLSRIDGAVLIAGAIAYTAFAYRGAVAGDTAEVAEEFEESISRDGSKLTDLALVAGGVALLVGGADLLVRGASAVAVALGVSQAVIALTVIAIGTSLPELATSVVAARKEDADVAFGNVIGSNTLNILAVLGIVALIHPFTAEGLRPLDFAMLVGTAVLVLALMARGWVLNRFEGGVLVVLYGAYVFSLVA